MKFEHYLKKVEEHKNFKEFKEKNPGAYLCAGFFILDYESGKDMHQIDYFLPQKKVATFFLDNEIKMKISEQCIKKKLPAIKTNPKTDLEALRGIVEDEMKNRTVTDKVRKMVAILHIDDNKLIWNLQVILDGLNILLVHVDDSDQNILKFEKHSLMELVKPMSGLQIMPSREINSGKSGEAGEEQIKKASSTDIEKIQEMLKKAVKEKIKEKVRKNKKTKS